MIKPYSIQSSLNTMILIPLGLLSFFGFLFIQGQALVLEGSLEIFQELYLKYEKICHSSNNFVASRTGFYYDDVHRYMPWSPVSGSIHHFLDLPYKAPGPKVHGIDQKNQTSPRFEYSYDNKEHNLPYCQTLDEIAYVIAQADWGTTPICKLRWLSGPTICKLMSQFSYVHFTGDSLQRHMVVGLMDLVSEDFQRGRYANNASINQCLCDGKYSELHHCIKQSQTGLFEEKLINFQPYGFCEDVDLLPTSMYFINTGEMRIKLDKTVTCEHVRKRPMFIGIQGGSWYKNEFSVVTKMFKQMLDHIKELYSECMDYVYIVFSGQHVCSSTLERMFAFQHHNHTHKYNIELMSWLSENSPNSYFLNTWNLSRMSLERNSDGFHYLTDRNVITALAFVNMMNLIHGQQKQPAKIQELLKDSHLINYA